ncbi:hypothetical protein EG829_07070 [bacterium]|nr:hypothetical protein [bacterium]
MKAFPELMQPSRFNKIMAVVLLVAIVAIAGNGRCFAQDVSHDFPSSYGKASGTASTADCCKESPCCPDGDGASAHHCGACFSCPCHAPLNMQGAQIAYSPTIVSISFLDFHNAPSDVFRPIFVPPQNHA